MKKFLTVLFYVMAAVYPVVVFTLLVVLKLPVRILSLCVMVLACSFFLGFTGRNRTDVKKEKKALDWRPMVSSALFLIAGIVCFVTNQSVFLKLYSVVISVVLLSVFGSTLFFEPNICFRFAVMSDKSIAGSSYEAQVCAYCRKVTVVWCCFFIINGSIAAYTALHDFGYRELNN